MCYFHRAIFQCRGDLLTTFDQQLVRIKFHSMQLCEVWFLKIEYKVNTIIFEGKN